MTVSSQAKDDQEPLGALITDRDEDMHRQISQPYWVEPAGPHWKAFRPRPSDRGRLSVTRGRRTDASEAIEFYRTVIKFNTLGCITASVGQLNDSGFPCHEWPLPNDPEHCAALSPDDGMQKQRAMRLCELKPRVVHAPAMTSMESNQGA